MNKKTDLFAGKYQKPDSEDPDTVNHLIWYEATNFTRPFPGEKKVRPASDFRRRLGRLITNIRRQTQRPSSL